MKRILCSLLFVVATTLGLHAGDDVGARVILDKLIAATAAKDYEAFVAPGTTQFQAALSKTQFEASATVLNPLFAKEHEISFLGELNQHGYEVYLYRVHFKDSSDDLLGTLSLKDGKVGGFCSVRRPLMPIRVKICGITNREDAEAAVEAGADALGFILYPSSKRFIPIERAIEIVQELPPFVQTVAVTVDATKEFSNLGWRKQLKRFNLAQLHGHESPVHCRAVGKYLPVTKVFPADKAANIQPDDYAVAAFMLDTPSPEHGGTGRTFDWKLALEFKQRTRRPLILSGGLNPDNVAEAIESVHPYAVDVSSGVELSPGKKDHAKLREFIRLCKKS